MEVVGLDEEWRLLPSHPQYEVSADARVRNRKTGVERHSTLNQYGVPKLNLMLDGGVQTLALNHIVANLYLEEPPRKDFDTVIHLDGDRKNCKAENLMWRPRHFAIKYHQQFEYEGFKHSHITVQDTKTERVYNRAQEAVMEHGILFQDILISIHQNTYVWPTYQFFRRPIRVGYNLA